jgi:predicted AAA+ superfamily ATPase
MSYFSRKPKPIDINPSNTLSEPLLDNLHLMNPWWRGNRTKIIPTNKRQIYPVLFESLLQGQHSIIALRGPRQVGKTTIQLQMIHDLLEQKRLVSPEQIIRIQFDSLESLALTDPIVTIINWFEKNVVKSTINNLAHQGKPVYIFLDEIQDVDNWSAQLKHIVDHRECRIFITGSSSLRILKEKESLAGRVYWNEINTLSLSEISKFRNSKILSPYTTEIDVAKFRDKKFWTDFKTWSSYESILLDEIYRRYCDFGGYPFCHIGDSVSWQKADEHLCDTVVARTIDHDLSVNFNLEYGKKMGMLSSTLLSNVFKIFCKYSGISVTLTTLQRALSASFSEQLKHNQIRMILDFFEHSMLIKVVKPFEHQLRNPREEVKICLCDHAIRKAWLKEDVSLYDTTINANLAGHIIEGIIGSFLKSIKGVGVSYFPAEQQDKNKKNEIDFILEIGGSHIPIEVKYSNTPQINAGITEFLTKKIYNAPFGLVITKEEMPLNCFGNSNIVPISAKKFLLLK